MYRFYSTSTAASVLACLVCLPGANAYKSLFAMACEQLVLLSVISRATFSIRLDLRQVATYLVMTGVDFMTYDLPGGLAVNFSVERHPILSIAPLAM